MKKIIAISLLFVASVTAQTQKLSLAESLELGLKNSKDLKISQSKLISSSAQVIVANSQLLPQIGLAASYMRLSNIPPFAVTVPFSPNPIQISPVILNNYSIRLSLQQPLFTGFRLLSLKSAAESNYEAANSDYQKDLNEAAYKIQNSFWNYFKAQQYDKILEDNLNQIKLHLDDTKNFMENGLATKNDMLKLEVQYSSVRLQKIEADNQLDIARMFFNQTLNLPLDSPTEIDVKLLYADTSEDKVGDLLKEAESKRNELMALGYRLNASVENFRAARSAWFPSIFLVGDYYYSKPNQRIIPAVNEFKDTWDLGVTLSWSVWNWGYTSSQTLIAEQNKIQVETSLSQLKEAIEIEVQQNYLTYKRAYNKVSVAKLSVDQAEENYRITIEKYNNQVATSTDLIDSEISLLQSKTNYNNVLVDYELAKVRLNKSVGRKIY